MITSTQEIESHKGDPLNDRLRITTFGEHNYYISADGDLHGVIRFHSGSLGERIDGISSDALIAILIDHFVRRGQYTAAVDYLKKALEDLQR